MQDENSAAVTAVKGIITIFVALILMCYVIGVYENLLA